MPYTDKRKQAEYYRQYAQKNREKIAKRQRAWLDADPVRRARYTEAQRQRYKADPEKYRKYFRNHRIKKKYDLTEAEYAALVVAQDGKCGICSNAPSGGWHGDRMLNVDHCYATGVIRGLLCNRCNRAIGLLGDTAEKVDRAVAYLRCFEEKNVKKEA